MLPDKELLLWTNSEVDIFIREKVVQLGETFIPQQVPWILNIHRFVGMLVQSLQYLDLSLSQIWCGGRRTGASWGFHIDP
jgi:hypothetical protein